MKMTQPAGDMPLDAIAFCDLIARILYRCLKDQKARLLLFSLIPEHSLNASSPEDDQSVLEMIHT